MTPHDQAVAEMKAFYETYIANFNGGHFTQVANFFAYPWLTLSKAGAIHVIPDEATQMKMWTQLGADLRARGWVRSIIERLDAYPTGTDTGLLDIDYARCRADDSIVERSRACYVVRRFDSRWKIVSAIEPPPR